MRDSHPAIRYTHTCLEIQLEIEKDRRFKHVGDVQAMIDLFGHCKDIYQPTGMVEIAQASALKLKHGYSVSAVYYDPAVTIRNLAEARQQSCVVCGVVHGNVIEIGNDSAFNVGYSTGYDALCWLCESKFRSYSRRMVKRGMLELLMDDPPGSVDWVAEWSNRQKANQIVATKWLLLNLTKAICAM